MGALFGLNVSGWMGFLAHLLSLLILFGLGGLWLAVGIAQAAIALGARR